MTNWWDSSFAAFGCFIAAYEYLVPGHASLSPYFPQKILEMLHLYEKLHMLDVHTPGGYSMYFVLCVLLINLFEVET
jgi:hypothetical protein